MKKVGRLWMPVLLGALLMSALVGVAGARPNARPEASPALENHMISAHHCNPEDETDSYEFFSNYLECSPGASCNFVCPIKPPYKGLIRVQRLAMYVQDNGTGEVCIWLHQVYPKTGTDTDRITNQCTINSAADPQVYAYNPANFKVSQLQDLYVWVLFTGTQQSLYGFKLKYEPL